MSDSLITPTEALLEVAKQHPFLVAVRSGEDQWSYAALWARVRQIADRIHDLDDTRHPVGLYTGCVHSMISCSVGRNNLAVQSRNRLRRRSSCYLAFRTHRRFPFFKVDTRGSPDYSRACQCTPRSFWFFGAASPTRSPCRLYLQPCRLRETSKPRASSIARRGS